MHLKIPLFNAFIVSIACMTGAISGARLGTEPIPEEWLVKLENRDYIEKLALDLREAAL